MKFTSIIITHHASTPERSQIFRQSLDSLMRNIKSPFELIVVDNGGNMDDSIYLLHLTEQGKINTYIRNSLNMHFGYARNQALSMAHGDYIAIMDNDLFHQSDWLSEAVELLESVEEKIYVTPMPYPTSGLKKKYNMGRVIHDNGKEYELNMRAGSNCFVMKKEDFWEVGGFLNHRIAGTHWTTAAVRKGYLALVLPEEQVLDIGLRQGYNLKQPVGIKKVLNNGEEIYFNQDEFKVHNPDKNYV